MKILEIFTGDRAVFQNTKWKIFLKNILLAIAYFFIAKISLSVTSLPEENVTTVWPVSGIALGIILWLGYSVWPGIMLAAFFVHFFNYWTVPLALTLAIAELSEPLLGAYLIRRFVNSYPLLERSKNVFLFVLIAAFFSPTVAATIGAIALSISGREPWANYGIVWWTWWIGDVVGILIFTPVILAWSQGFRQLGKRLKEQLFEGILLLLITLAVCRVAFGGGYPVEYMLIPLLVWSAFRFGQQGATLLILLVSVISIVGTIHGFGPFVRPSVNESLLLLQSFVGVVAITTLILCAVISENQQAQSRLKKVNEELEKRVEERTAELLEAKESAEIAKEAADAANKAKSEFLANMSHELRTPLNGILGYAQILQRDRSLTTIQKDGINIIGQCGNHLLTLINDVLDLSKIEARKMELYPQDFHFPSFLMGVVEMCRIKARQQGISFIYQPDASLPEGIRADEKRLRQVLINLLGNAIKFTNQGGITFQVEVVGNEAINLNGDNLTSPPTPLLQGEGCNTPSNTPPFPGSREGGAGGLGLSRLKLVADNGEASNPSPISKIRFQVEDTGIGISPEQLEKIFIPFEQVGKHSTQLEGTGLGLAISQKIIQMMGSNIEVRSQLGQGSILSFEIELPIAVEWATTAKVVDQGIITGFTGRESVKILVVDDKWENRSVIVHFLTPLGFELIEATDGIEGLEKATTFKPDLILVDLVMPKMHGFEMVKKLREIPEFKEVAIIISSASVFEADKHKSLDAGSNDFLPKPVQMSELLDKLKTHLNLEWVYEHHPVSLTETERLPEAEILDLKVVGDEAIAPNAEALAQLYDLAKQGLVIQIEEIAEKLAQTDARLLPFTKNIIQLAQEFEVEKIQVLLESYL